MTTAVDVRRYTPAAIIAFLAAMAGLGVSIYLTIEHYDTNLTLACPENSAINCAKVTTSSWSVIAGVPVAVLGLAYFAVMTVLLALPARNAVIEWLQLIGAIAGVGMVIYLVSIELFAVNAICLWCTAVHVLTLVMFAAVLWRHVGPSAHD